MKPQRDCVCATCGAPGRTRQGDPVWCPDCMEAGLKPGQVIATCRYCGETGIEDADDPSPGVCPDCFSARLPLFIAQGVEA